MSCTKRLSPGANLLRQSRLMAMPPPVPPPPSYFLKNPDVSPHPTIQAITTPPSSHARGNWGLKRDLPTKTKYPYLRYRKLDTLEHFTDYESAGDDVITLKKWQEMDIPIFKGPTTGNGVSNSYTMRETVFDYVGEGTIENYKWRYDGPYLPDMPAGEFKRYIEAKIKPRRQEFIKFVAKNRKAFASGSNSQNYNNSRSVETPTPIQIQWNPTKPEEKLAGPEEKLTELEKEKNELEEIKLSEADILTLRADTFLLERLVLAFLDAPLYSRPHRTHPSAGLHYTRSSAHVRNDPIEGPKHEVKPVLGRYMNHIGSSGTMIGIGGFIAKASDAARIDAPLKLYNNRQYTRKYAPGMARLDALGRVMLEVDTVNEGELRGRFGAGGGEKAADMLKEFSTTREWSGLYNAGGEKSASPGPRPEGVVNKSPMRGKYTDAIMDLLSDARRP